MAWPAFLGRLWPRPYLRREACEVLVIRLPEGAQAEDAFCVRNELNRLAPDYWLSLNPRAYQVMCLGVRDGAVRIGSIREAIESQCRARDSLRETRFGQSTGECTVSFGPRGQVAGPVLGPALVEAMKLAQ